ncbi:3-oxoacyl-acyl carrier protein reductase [Aspergillus avenaceus]|uniref:3-oxoacyl-acyl carrier protein reductase n=1 Tax=Aspergillus avenaceus TaxID=36643 RepID=A0A5N6U3A6_ASPAV|nr:3-oxoacyl-acyl carrier protein reductase [Aspergillus avenaceus]
MHLSKSIRPSIFTCCSQPCTAIPKLTHKKIYNVSSSFVPRRAYSQGYSGRLSGRTCMVTGGTSGIGFAIAERFLREGAEHIILVGRSHERLLKAASKLEGSRLRSHDRNVGENNADQIQRSPETSDLLSMPQGTLVQSSERLSLLVGDVADAELWLRELEKAMAKVDILINAAGISHSNILPKTSTSEITATLRTNLEGAILTSRALLRASLRNRLRHTTSSTFDSRPASKCIINISSLLALKGGTGAVPYAASKAGLLGLTRSLTVEAAASLRDVVVRSNAIVPGYIETPMISEFSEGENQRLKNTIPLGRFGKPDEVADAAAFLAGNEYANNCVINLDGGLSAV